MPDKSKAQQRAMAAAASGKSSLSIPAKVGKDYLAADRAAGPRKLPQHVKPAGKGHGLING